MAAPVGRVWDEITSLDTILAATAGLVPDEPAGALSAPVALQLAWGPWSWTAHGHAALRQVDPPHHLLVVVTLVELALEYRGAVDLTATGSDQARVRYSGRLRCDHRLTRRCPRLLEAVVEDHVRAVLATVRRRAESRYQARVRLSDPRSGQIGAPGARRAVPARRWA